MLSSFIDWWRWRWIRMPAKNELQSPEYARQHVRQSDEKQHWAREKPDSGEQRADDQNQAERLALAQVDVLEVVKPPCTDHQKSRGQDECEPNQGHPPLENRLAAGEMNHRRNHAGT